MGYFQARVLEWGAIAFSAEDTHTHTHTHTHITYIYAYINEYYSDIKKNEIMLFAVTWMDLEIIILSEVS